MSPDDTNDTVYIARLVGIHGIQQVIEFTARDDRAAWREANDGIDPLSGHWVEVFRKPDPQQAMHLPPAEQQLRGLAYSYRWTPTASFKE